MTKLKKFKHVAMGEDHPHWPTAIARQQDLYRQKGEIRTPFERDYTRILHCSAYHRLKHKTQVFFSPQNDHISTRIEHVGYVESISSTICTELGLNTELVRAIAIGHDLGHAPFGHEGEKILQDLQIEEGLIADKSGYWHERNSLHFVDHLEILEGPDRKKRNLCLTYAVRDGIISHCGEVTERCLYPRAEAISLDAFKVPNQFAPFTWEGCVVKIADNISYLGRDIEDALTLGLLDEGQRKELTAILSDYNKPHSDNFHINNTTLIHTLVMDLCEHASPEEGLAFSKQGFQLMERVQHYNIDNIYEHEKLDAYKRYGNLVIREVYHALCRILEESNQFAFGVSPKAYPPKLAQRFYTWLRQYWDGQRDDALSEVRPVYHLKDCPTAGKRAVIDYISGMTDSHIEKVYQEVIRL
jgi:dGTPase